MPNNYRPIAFISEEIKVEFDHPPTLAKKPDPPVAFTWSDEHFPIREVLSRWFDFDRRGKMARNMSEPHLREATRHGSWGVGRFYFRVRVAGGRIFDLYYDRAPESAADRKGHWFLWRELAPPDSQEND